MSKFAPYLSDIHATLVSMYERQQLYIERKAAEEAKADTIKPEIILANVQAEEAAAREDMTALHDELKERAQRFTEASKELTARWDNSGSAELQNLFKVIELTGEAITPAQALSTAESLRGDYISLAAVAGAYDKAKNERAAQVIRKLTPDIGAAMQKLVKDSEMIRGIAYGVGNIARSYYELCEAFGIKYDPNEFEDPFEVDQWRREAGLID